MSQRYDFPKVSRDMEDGQERSWHDPCAAPRAGATPARQSVAAQLSRMLEERRAWVSSSTSRSHPSPPSTRNSDEPRVPLRLVVSKCLDDWGIESDSSEDTDDFCGWRVGSRAVPVPYRKEDERCPSLSNISISGSSSNHALQWYQGTGTGTGSSTGRPPGPRSCSLQ